MVSFWVHCGLSLHGTTNRLRIRNFRVYEILKIRKKIVKISFYRITSNCKVLEFAQQLAVDYTEATVEWEQWAVMIDDCDSDTGEDSEAAGDS